MIDQKHSSDNLPIQLSSFIGREREITEVKRLLSLSRLVTLTGAGGSGKTRLALRVAQDFARDDSARGDDWANHLYKDGVWWVDLAGLAHESLVPSAVASALGIPEVSNRPAHERLVHYLHAKHMLLVMDNCEHLITACAQIVETCLSVCANLKILVTSREALGLFGETVLQVPTLTVPDLPHSHSAESALAYESIRLFVERAQAVKPDFALTEKTTPVVIQICQRLDGIPLAIELAATRVKVLTPEHILERLADRFNLLIGGHRTALPRHQTLYATIAWSYELLPEEARLLFRRLSLFAGGFTLDAAEQVCADERLPAQMVLAELSRLVDRSLLTVRQVESEERYLVLETIREFARDKLIDSGEETHLRERHLDFFCALAERAEPHIRRADQLVWLDQLDSDLDNLRAALQWSLNGGNAESGMRLVGASLWFWFIRGHSNEGGKWVRALLKLPRAQKRTIGRAKALRALVLGEGFEPTTWRQVFDEILEIWTEFGDTWRIALTWAQLAETAIVFFDDVVTARSALEQALGLAQQLEDDALIANVLRWQSNLLQRTDLIAARSLLEESVSLYKKIGDKFHLAWEMSGLGMISLALGESSRAAALCEEALAIARAENLRVEIPGILNDLANVMLTQANVERAESIFKEALSLAQEIEHIGHVSNSLLGFAEIAQWRGQSERAARLWGAVNSIGHLLIESPDTRWAAKGITFDRYVSDARAKLGTESFQEAWAEGQALTVEQAIAYALEPQRTREQTARVAQPPTARQGAKKESGGLTEREREVARGIARGESNREIAEKLVVSERTVETHVGNILNKLGFSARAQIRKWAIEKGLVKRAE